MVQQLAAKRMIVRHSLVAATSTVNDDDEVLPTEAAEDKQEEDKNKNSFCASDPIFNMERKEEEEVGENSGAAAAAAAAAGARKEEEDKDDNERMKADKKADDNDDNYEDDDGEASMISAYSVKSQLEEEERLGEKEEEKEESTLISKTNNSENSNPTTTTTTTSTSTTTITFYHKCNNTRKIQPIAALSPRLLVNAEFGPPPNFCKPVRPLKWLSENQRAAVFNVRKILDKLPLIDEEMESPLSPLSCEGNVSSSWFSRDNELAVENLTFEELLWTTDLVIARFLRSYGWKVATATQKLRKTLWWRRLRKPDCIMPADVENHLRYGSCYRRGFDFRGNAIVYFRPCNEKTRNPREMVDSVLYTLERAIASLDTTRGRDQVTFILDFNSWEFSQVPPLEVSSEVVHILNDHYTDVLYEAFIFDAPSFFNSVWQIIRIAVHPDTAKKVVFLSSSSSKDLEFLRRRIPEEYLESWCKGPCSVEFNFDVYWKQEEIHFVEEKMMKAKLRSNARKHPALIKRLEQKIKITEAESSHLIEEEEEEEEKRNSGGDVTKTKETDKINPSISATFSPTS